MRAKQKGVALKQKIDRCKAQETVYRRMKADC